MTGKTKKIKEKIISGLLFFPDKLEEIDERRFFEKYKNPEYRAALQAKQQKKQEKKERAKRDPFPDEGTVKEKILAFLCFFPSKIVEGNLLHEFHRNHEEEERYAKERIDRALSRKYGGG